MKAVILMNKEEILVIYKEVGKEPKLKKIQNELKDFENLIGGELDYIPYEDITIVARKDRKNLKSNIYINTTLLNIRERNIKGTILVTCKERQKFKTLNTEQVLKYMKFLKEEAFNYDFLDTQNKK